MIKQKNNKKNNKALVTGGAGFIGSHLCRFLLKKGFEVTCADNFFTGRRENIKDLLSNALFHVREHDIIKPLKIQTDFIFNLACPASPVHYQYNPVKTIKTNILGVSNMLDLAKETGARILQASTSEVYGDPKEHPQKESYWGNVNPIGPRSCYDEGKRAAETMMMDFHRQEGVKIKIIRIFNTYGPQMAINDGRVVSNFIVQALQNKDITLFGDGSQTRSFCYVSDMIGGMYQMMMSDEKVTGPINLGNPKEFTIHDLAQKIISLTNSQSRIIFLPLPQDDPVRRKPDISLAKKYLDWEPYVPLDKGLKETISYFKTIVKNV